MIKLNISYKLLFHNLSIDSPILKRIVSIDINKIYNNKRTILDTSTNIFIKFIEKHDDDTFKENIEFFFTSEIINKYFVHNHLIDYYGIIEIYKKNKDIESLGILMPIYQTLNEYLDTIIFIDSKILLSNILGIIDLTEKIRDKYDFINIDVKLDNILVKDSIFYLIDWERVYYTDQTYLCKSRPKSGNTEMYPFYDATIEEFFIHSIGVLIIRILGYKYGITHNIMMQNLTVDYILSYIPASYRNIYENIIIKIYFRKYHKIEELKNEIEQLLSKENKNG